MLECLKFVDEVRIFEEETPLYIIKQVKPKHGEAFILFDGKLLLPVFPSLIYNERYLSISTSINPVRSSYSKTLNS